MLHVMKKKAVLGSQPSDGKISSSAFHNMIVVDRWLHLCRMFNISWCLHRDAQIFLPKVIQGCWLKGKAKVHKKNVSRVVLWMVWLERNDKIFENKHRNSREKYERMQLLFGLSYTDALIISLLFLNNLEGDALSSFLKNTHKLDRYF